MSVDNSDDPNSNDLFDSRMKQIGNLEDFIQGKCKRLTQICDNLGWTVESLLNQDKVQCQFNKGHWVKRSELKKHEDVCSVVSEGYSREDLAKEQTSSKFFYENSNCVAPIKVGNEEMKEIMSEVCSNSEMQSDMFQNFKCQKAPSFPKTMDRYLSEFSPEERLSIYDYVVKKSKQDKNPPNFELEDLLFDFEKKEEAQKAKSYLEILAEQRDYKRRRQSYRAKNVHITKKSYTEVMKEVIENQISYLKETWKLEEGDVQESDEPKSNLSKESKRSQYDYEQKPNREDERDKYGRSHSHDKSHKSRHHHRSKRSRSRSPSRHRSKHKKHKKHKSHH